MFLKGWTFVLLLVVHSDAEPLEMIPAVTEQVVKSNSNLTLICTYEYNNTTIENTFVNITWKLPDFTTTYPEETDVEKRFRVSVDRNDTHLRSTMNLLKAIPSDTGAFSCATPQGTKIEQYVYVYSVRKLVFIETEIETEFVSVQGIPLDIPCKATHPNVTVSLLRGEPNANGEFDWSSKVLSSDPNNSTDWLFIPKLGLRLLNPKVSDIGQYMCLGSMNIETAIRNTDEEFTVYVRGMELVRDGEEDPVEGTNVTLICRTVIQNKIKKTIWQPEWAYYTTNDTDQMQMINQTNPPKGIQIIKEVIGKTLGDYWYDIHESRLILLSVTVNTCTHFQCKANINRQKVSQTISFNVKEVNNDPADVKLGRGIVQNLTCNRPSDQVPIQWLKDDMEYSGLIYYTDNQSILPLRGLASEIGTYVCSWNNSRGEARRRIFTFAEETKTANITIAICTFVLFVLTLGLGISWYLDKKNRREELERILLNSNPDGIIPNLPIDYQTEFLPYDKRCEFPRNRLKLVGKLGEGCFGEVFKAEAVEIIKGESVTTVAVKTVRSQSKFQTKKLKETATMDALISELKILNYLGSHLNVVNLLGACTKDLIKGIFYSTIISLLTIFLSSCFVGELLVIIDYCRYGNLRCYLIKHRLKFVNLLDNWGNMTCGNELQEIYKSASKASIDKENEPSHSHPADADFPQEAIDFQEPETIWKYGEDADVEDNKSVSTWDLIRWTLQIARGMEYLTSKKVLHGDLAARNVLLADHGIIKIADFGMSRKLYDYNCEIKGQELLPIKWMAVESLTDHIFSSQSDVWSYGILLWELFSLGRIPYPGRNGPILVKHIQNGHRMEKPEFSPNFFGEVMKNCWEADPKERPTFCDLEEKITDYIKLLVGHDYLDTNLMEVDPSKNVVNHSSTSSLVPPVTKTVLNKSPGGKRRLQFRNDSQEMNLIEMI